MNVIHFSPHFPDNYYHFSVGLRNAGATALGIGDASFDSLRPELKNALTEYYRVNSMEDYDQILRAAGYFTHRYGKIDRINSFSEHWLDLEARIRTDFNLFGLKAGDMRAVKRKSMMKERFIKAGIPVARGHLVQDRKTAESFVREVGYPVVAKPDNGVGALNTYKISTDQDLDAFFRIRSGVDYIMEEFIAGEVISFDGLTDRSGTAVFYTGHVFMSGIMDVVNEDTDLAYYSFRTLPDDLKAAGLSVVKAFDIRERFFHIEFFRTHKDGKVVALEVNMRPPGGYTTDMFNFANDIDIYQEWANVVVHNQFRASYERKYHCCYIGRKFNRQYVRSHEQVLQMLGPLLVMHTPVSGVFRAAIGDYAYLVRSADKEEVRSAIALVQATETDER